MSGTPDTPATVSPNATPAATAVDAISEPEDRLIPLFKWRTSAPVKTVVLMKAISDTDIIIFLNTTFAGGNDPIGVGEILIFTDPVTFEQVGRIITAVDITNNQVTLEVTPGFAVDRATPLTAVPGNIGATLDSNSNVLVSNYSKKYSDEGVAVITAITPGDPTDLFVNNVSAFRDFKFTAYNAEGYKHYSFLVTTSASMEDQTRALPTGTPTTEQVDPTAWIANVLF